ncbi:MAG: LysE family translocator [Actinomycetota bacterium]|nr:LysE family translocator [Actinomycetota bacterium]
MRSIPEFFLIALIVTLTPGPATALVVRVAARDGRRAAMQAVLGNSVGVLTWGSLSALGVSSLILASQIAFDLLRIAGAVVLLYLGVRSVRHRGDQSAPTPIHTRVGWRTGLITSFANPKLALFFIALFPQFLLPGANVLPIALAMAVVIVAYDVLWFGTLIWAVDRASTILRPPVRRAMERVVGAVMIGLGISVAVEAR